MRWSKTGNSHKTIGKVVVKSLHEANIIKTNYKNIELVVITDNIEIKDIKTIASKENYLEQYNEIIKSSGSEYFMILDSQFLDINSNMWIFIIVIYFQQPSTSNCFWICF